MADEHDNWVFPYSQKYKGYIVDATSFIEFLARSNISNKNINNNDNNNGVEKVFMCSRFLLMFKNNSRQFR